MSLDEAVAGFTTGAAYAAFVDGAPHADLTIYDGKLDATSLLERKVAMTIVDGKVVYDAHETGATTAAVDTAGAKAN
jgi:predicted amidohydrolase YtcJ